ncbi:hypothetical protein GCM10018772_45670 [Streptomyces fumanus]|uniref:Uncharacterized protein n=1 Tax=Streptomyces fumanus TaxID=67302 RepID=A0A919AMQ6_9ACTN|nr:hypothetical protein GCM10018772_45670 [Streptomyces fumanus]
MELPSTSTTSCTQSGSVLKTYGRFSASFSAGITTLTGGAMAKWVETGRYLAAAGGSPPVVVGGRTEPMSLVPLVRRTAAPERSGTVTRFERGVVLIHVTDASRSVPVG